MTLCQGEVYWAFIPPKRHYVIIVSRESLNRGKYVQVVPVTDQHFDRRSKLLNCIPFRRGQFCFTSDCVAQAENMTLYSKADLDLESGPQAELDGEALREVIRAIGDVIAAECEPGPIE